MGRFGLDPVELRSEIPFKNQRRAIAELVEISAHPFALQCRQSACHRRQDAFTAQRSKIKLINEGRRYPNRVSFGHVVVKRLWQQSRLPPVFRFLHEGLLFIVCPPRLRRDRPTQTARRGRQAPAMLLDRLQGWVGDSPTSSD